VVRSKVGSSKICRLPFVSVRLSNGLGSVSKEFGDLLACYETVHAKGGGPWKPRSGIHRIMSA